ncbi:hypothetical protein ABIA33_001336 [Streptacidiphilus sp. MAP12-16]|uniref:hypothetical protein n=1 Tax=Streptacidiphilus sp. MAP12-16 TaxID=3156300 RepID=UPI00351116A6
MTLDESHRARADALRSVVGIRGDLRTACADLAAFGWDSSHELIELTRSDAIRVLEAVLSGELRPEEWRLWAETLEGRDDLAFEGGHADLLKEFLLESATPEIFDPLTAEVATHWLSQLG